MFKGIREFILGTEHQRECNLEVGLISRHILSIFLVVTVAIVRSYTCG